MGFELKLYLEPENRTNCGACWGFISSIQEGRSPACDIFGPLPVGGDGRVLRSRLCIESELDSKEKQ